MRILERRLRPPLFVALGVVACSLGMPSTAQSGESARSYESLTDAQRKRLQSHVEAGREAYDRRNYEKSLREFQSALEILEHPDFVYRVALAYERLEREKEAIEAYRRFLEMAPDTDDRREVEKTIERLEREIARSKPTVQIRTDPGGARVRLSETGRELGTSELEATLEPGSYTLVVSKSGYRTVEREIELEKGEALSVNYELERRGGGETRAVPTGAVLMFGAGGVATGGAVFSYLRFVHFRSRVRQQRSCSPNCTEPGSFDSNVRSQKLYEGLAWGSGALAAATLGAGVAWMMLARTPDERASGGGASVSIRPQFAVDRIGFVLTVGGARGAR